MDLYNLVLQERNANRKQQDTSIKIGSRDQSVRESLGKNKEEFKEDEISLSASVSSTKAGKVRDEIGDEKEERKETLDKSQTIKFNN